MIKAYASLRAKLTPTLKLLDVEERYDLYFSRPAGYLLAVGAAKLGMTPTQVSLASMFTGIVAGYLYFFRSDVVLALLGSLLLTLAGLLDSADGQLARMTNQSTPLGRIIDGIIDNVVFMACYLGGVMSYVYDPEFGWYMFWIGFVAGYSQSFKQGVYEYMKTEYMFYVKGDYKNRIERLDELQRNFKRDTLLGKFFYYAYYDYLRKLERVSFRSLKTRDAFERWAYNEKTRDYFVAKYRESNYSMLSIWAWFCGTNTHRGAIMIATLLGHFDWFFWFSIATVIPVLFIGLRQMKRDRQLIAHMSEREPELLAS